MVGTFGGLQQTQVAVLRLSNWSVLKRLKEEREEEEEVVDIVRSIVMVGNHGITIAMISPPPPPNRSD